MADCNCTIQGDFNTISICSSFYNDGRTYRYVQCKICLSLFWDDVEEPNTYTESYYSFSKVSTNKIAFLQKQRYLGDSWLARITRSFIPLSLMNTVLFDIIRQHSYNILDYGSGSGAFGQYLEDLGYGGKTFSYDPYYSGRSENIITNPSRIPWSEVDIIYSNQVFEHIVNLRDHLGELFQKVKVGTRIVFSVPLLGSLLKEYGEYAFILQIPDHKSLYTLNGLENVLNQTYWEVISTKTEDLHSEYAKLSDPIGDLIYRKDMFNSFKYEGGNNVVITLRKSYE